MWPLVIAAALLPVAVRLLALAAVPPPVPAVQDEFAYLLGADTLARGRLANETPAMADFFETIHVIVRPTYSPKYPPGQALILAFGKAVFGHPYAGAVLSFGAMSGSLVWMLCRWLPRRWAVAGAIYTCLVLFPPWHHWMNSYWGGCVAATGSALLVGSLGLLRDRRWGVGTGLSFGAGAGLMALSRPYEGLLVAVAVVGVAALSWREQRASAGRFLIGAAIPILLCGGFLGAVNRAATGQITRMAYWEHDRQYAWTPVLWLLPLREPARRMHPDLQRFQEKFERAAYEEARERWWWVPAKRLLVQFPLGVAILLGFFGSRAADPWLRRCSALFLFAFLPLLLHKVMLRYYLAPVIPPAMLLCMLWAERYWPLARTGGLRLAAYSLLLLSTFVMPAGGTVNRLLELSGLRIAPVSPVIERPRLASQLMASPGDDVVIVRYGPKHNVVEEWVYNDADLEHGPVLWARDLGCERNRELLRHYPDRRFWLLEADVSPRSLKPYREACADAGPREPPPQPFQPPR